MNYRVLIKISKQRDAKSICEFELAGALQLIAINLLQQTCRERYPLDKNIPVSCSNKFRLLPQSQLPLI